MKLDFVLRNRKRELHDCWDPCTPMSCILKVLGKGSSGTVWLVQPPDRSDSTLYAIKSASQTWQHCDVRTEETLLAQSRHECIVRSFGSILDRRHRKAYMAQEACLGGDLSQLLRQEGRLPEGLARTFTACITSAIGYLHSQHIMYRDLKPENLVLDQRGLLKLVDFGLAKTTAEPAHTLCGTPEYVAPEMIERRGHGPEVDWWGLGVVLYEMLHGHTPFNGPDQSEAGLPASRVDLFARVTNPFFKVTYDTTLSKPVLSFMKRLLRRKVESRLGHLGVAAVQEVNSSHHC